MKIIVIGGGFGGLASATELASQGHDVTILEKNKHVGGRADYHSAYDFSFDLGPTWYLMPRVVDEFFSRLGADRSQYYGLKRLDPLFRVVTPKDYYDINSEFRSCLDVFEKIAPGSSSEAEELLLKSRQAYKIISSRLGDEKTGGDLDQIKDWAYNHLRKLKLLRSYRGFLRQSIRSPEIRNLLEAIPMQLGLNPTTLPAFHVFWLATLFDDGLWFPSGGFKNVAISLEKLARSKGVKILCSENVNKINVSKGVVKSLDTGEETFFTDGVVSSIDYAFTETKLLPPIYRTYPSAFWQGATYSSTAIIMCFGIRDNLDGSLAIHNMFIDENWQKFCIELKAKKASQNIQFFASLPSLADSSLAPDGCHSLRVVVPFPTSIKVDMKQLSLVRDQVIKRIENHIGKKLDIIYEQIKPPGYYKRRFNAFNSNAYGLAHTNSQDSILRPVNKSLKVSGLYFAGQDTKPGIGIPFVFASAKNIVKEIKL